MSRVLDVADQAAWWLRKNARFTLPIGVLVVAGVVVLAVAGGGSSEKKIPASASALVGDVPISNTDVDHWQSVYTKAATASGSSTSTAEARKAAVAMLVQSSWVIQEADEQKVSVTPAQIDEAESAYLQQLGAGADKAAALRQAGLAEADLKYQLRLSLLTSQLQSKIAKKVPAPSAADIQKEYETNPGRWARPSKRDVRMVVASTKANAAAALAALKGGKSFGEVSKQYTTDATLAQNGGVVKGIVPGSAAGDLEGPLFAAQVNSLQGPIRTTSGWVVFKVQKSVPSAEQTLQQATAKIKQDLTSTRQAAAVTEYVKDMQARWQKKTRCQKDVAVASVCPKA
ncbi:MAG TPA: peptidyl-prolyl cis-trans isomerase [Solirubrobacteraceae bacterium]